MTTKEFIKESNKIEGILRPPTMAEINEQERFMSLNRITVDDLIKFVNVYQPNAKLRDEYGMNVRVGNYRPPEGGPRIAKLLTDFLSGLNLFSAFEAHCYYEALHPFTDGNGRSGRAIWAWRMGGYGLGFLHSFYYQCLANNRIEL